MKTFTSLTHSLSLSVCLSLFLSFSALSFYCNIQIDETSNSDELVGMEFLMMVMEIRESIDSALPSDMNSLLEETQSNIQKIVMDLETAFDGAGSSDDGDIIKKNDEETTTTTIKNIDKTRQLTAQLQYWNRIEFTIRDKMEMK